MGVAAAQSFQCETICCLWKGRRAPEAGLGEQRRADNSPLEREETQQQQRLCCFPPKYQSSSSSRAGCWCRQAGGQRRRRRRRQAEESGGEGTAQKTPLTLLLPSTRFVPPVLAVSGLGVSSSPRFLSLERPCSSDGWATRGARTHLSQCSNGCRQSAAPRIGESYFDRMGVIVKWQIFR